MINDVTIVLAVFAGLYRMGSGGVRRYPGLLFAGGMLLTSVLVHSFHRPWFGYYALHFHIPAAILAAHGAGWLLRRAFATPARVAASDQGAEGSPAWLSGKSPARFSWSAVAVAVIVSGWFGFRLPSATTQWHQLRHAPTASGGAFLPAIRGYASRASWLYFRDEAIVFHSGILQPPELVLRTSKRVDLGELSNEIIYETIRRYRPEIMLLGRSGELANEDFRAWIKESGYEKILEHGNRELWVLRHLAPKRIRNYRELVAELNL